MCAALELRASAAGSAPFFFQFLQTDVVQKR